MFMEAPMPDAVGAALVTQAVATVARSTLVDSVRNYAALYGMADADQIIPAADALLRQPRV